MSKYYVSLAVYANHTLTVEADSEKEAIDKALDEGPPMLCHYCSDSIEIGEYMDEPDGVEYHTATLAD